MKEQTLIKALEMHDKHLNALHKEFQAMQKVLDKTYVHSLTHVMMWDCLLALLNDRNMITKTQFETALAELGAKTKQAMDAESEQRLRAQESPAVVQ